MIISDRFTAIIFLYFTILRCGIEFIIATHVNKTHYDFLFTIVRTHFRKMLSIINELYTSRRLHNYTVNNSVYLILNSFNFLVISKQAKLFDHFMCCNLVLNVFIKFAPRPRSSILHHVAGARNVIHIAQCNIVTLLVPTMLFTLRNATSSCCRCPQCYSHYVMRQVPMLTYFHHSFVQP